MATQICTESEKEFLTFAEEMKLKHQKEAEEALQKTYDSSSALNFELVYLTDQILTNEAEIEYYEKYIASIEKNLRNIKEAIAKHKNGGY